MPLPTPDEMYDYLEGYNINKAVISEAWVTQQMNDEIVPYVEHLLGFSLSAESTITEYHSGNGSDILILNKKGISSVESIELVSGHDISGTISLSSIEILADKGMLKAKTGVPEYYDSRSFPKGNNNIKVTYKIGGAFLSDLMTAVKMLTSIVIFSEIADRTGGGNVTIQGFNRNFGNAGRYTNICKRFNKRAHAIIGKYTSSVVGS